MTHLTQIVEKEKPFTAKERSDARSLSKGTPPWHRPPGQVRNPDKTLGTPAPAWCARKSCQVVCVPGFR